MSSYRQILYHVIFRTKGSKKTLSLEHTRELYAYIMGIIKNQQEHHKKMSFVEEYRKLLKEHEIKIDERYFP